MTLIANIINDQYYGKINFSDVVSANPGVGGTTYQQVLLSVYLNNMTQFKILSICFSENITIPKPYIRALDYNHIIQILKEHNVGILILNYDEELFRLLHKMDMLSKIILIGHVHLSEIAYNYVKNTQNLYVVFPTRQVALHYLDTPIFNKIYYIPYFIPITDTNYINSNHDSDSYFDITYIGSLTKTKGFHLLARQWKRILKKIPNARLNIIGSGKLYNPNQILGPFNLASKKYESSFLKYLTVDGILPDNVIFHGTMGPEKDEVLSRTKVGIVNPIAVSETFCLSVFDFTAKKIPIVTMRRFALVETVVEYRNGITYRFKSGLSSNVIKLHRDKKLYRLIYSNSGKDFISEQYPIGQSIDLWINLIDNNEKKNIDIYENLRENFNFLRVINYNLRRLIPNFPPMVVYSFIYTKFKRFVRLILNEIVSYN